MGGGRGILSAGLLAGRFRQSQKPSHWSSRWSPTSWTGKSLVLPLRQCNWRFGAQSIVPLGQLRAILRLKLQVPSLQEATNRSCLDQPILLTSNPASPVNDLF